VWSRLDDALIDHRKIFAAAEVIGDNGGAIALGIYAVGLMWANKHLSDGFLPLSTVRRFPHVADPLAVADALVAAGLWTRDQRDGIEGFFVHDFSDWNLSGRDVRARRAADADRKRRGRNSDKRRRRQRGNGKLTK
jgi:hypothetical protein